MSIITEALKKAERERELKAKRASAEAAVAILEEAKLEETPFLNSSVPDAYAEKSVLPAETPDATLRQSQPFSSWRAQEILVVAATVILCLAILFLLPRWPRVGENLSLKWSPFQGGGVFQISLPSMYQQGVSNVDSRARDQAKLPFHLTGVSVQGSDRYAIINGTIVQKGDSIDGAHVKEILDREVILETRSGEIKLKIPS